MSFRPSAFLFFSLNSFEREFEGKLFQKLPLIKPTSYQSSGYKRKSSCSPNYPERYATHHRSNQRGMFLRYKTIRFST